MGHVLVCLRQMTGRVRPRLFLESCPIFGSDDTRVDTKSTKTATHDDVGYRFRKIHNTASIRVPSALGDIYLGVAFHAGRAIRHDI